MIRRTRALDQDGTVRGSCHRVRGLAPFVLGCQLCCMLERLACGVTVTGGGREGSCELRLKSLGESQAPLRLAGDWKGSRGAGVSHQPPKGNLGTNSRKTVEAQCIYYLLLCNQSCPNPAAEDNEHL